MKSVKNVDVSIRGNVLKVDGSTFTGPKVLEFLGTSRRTVLGKTYTSAIVVIENGDDAKLNPDNERLEGEGYDRPSPKAKEKSVQKTLQSFLGTNSTNPTLRKAADRLNASYDLHKGQTQTLLMHLGVFRDGNRRAANAKGREDMPTLVVEILPDDMPTVAVDILVSQLNGVTDRLEWASFVKAKQASEFMTEHGMDIKQVVALFGFNSVKDAEKYIHSYEWFAQSELEDVAHWSKFHHAYVPALVKHFGYNKVTRTFGERERSNEKANLTPEGVDEVAKMTTDFKWLMSLIDTGRVTDCRQCDGVVAPAIRDADKDHGQKVLELLNSEPSDKAGALPPAEKAWAFLKGARNDSALKVKADELTDMLSVVLKSGTKKSELKIQSADNILLRSVLDQIRVQISVLVATMPAA